MLVQKLSAMQELVNALPRDAMRNSAAMPVLQKLQESMKETVEETVQEALQESAGRMDQYAVPPQYDSGYPDKMEPCRS